MFIRQSFAVLGCPLDLVFALVLLLCVQVVQVTADTGVFVECNRRGKERVPSLGMCCFRYLGCRCIKALCLKSDYAKSEECVQNRLYNSECNTTYNANCESYQDSSFASMCNNTDPDVTANDKWKARDTSKNSSSSTQTILIVVVVVFILLALIVAAVWWFYCRARPAKKTNGSSDKAGQRSSSGKASSGKRRRTGSGSRKKLKKRKSTAKAPNVNLHTARTVGGSGKQFDLLTAKKGASRNSKKASHQAKGSTSRKALPAGESFNSRAVSTRQLKDNNQSNKTTSNEATKQQLIKALK